MSRYAQVRGATEPGDWQDGEGEMLVDEAPLDHGGSSRRVHHEAKGSDEVAEEPVKSEGEWVWRLVLARLALFAFFMNFTPSEPFLTKYLLQDKNISMEDLNTKVWPSDTYANLAFLLPVGLLAEYCGYRVVILLGLLAQQLTRILLIWGQGTATMQAMQVSYALESSCNSVFFAYALLVVPTTLRSVSTGVAYASFHLGSVFGSLVGELIYDLTKASLVDLFYLSWASKLFALLLFFLILPKPVEYARPSRSLAAVVLSDGICGAARTVVETFLEMLPAGLIWCGWWVFASAGEFIYGNYYQAVISNLDSSAPFGWIEMGLEASHVLGALAAILLAKFLIARSAQFGFTALNQNSVLFISFALVLFDFITIKSTSVVEAASFISLRAFSYSLAQSTAQPVIAKSMIHPYFAIVFTFNTLLALVVTTIISSIGSSQNWETLVWYSTIIVLNCLGILAACCIGCAMASSNRSWDRPGQDSRRAPPRGALV